MSCTFLFTPIISWPHQAVCMGVQLVQSMPYLFWDFSHSLFAAGIICLSLPFNELPLCVVALGLTLRFPNQRS